MESLTPYVIPENIRRIDFNSKFLNIDEARSSESDYISALSAMIYMEELANSVQLQQYNIQKAQIQLHLNNIVKTTRTVNIPIILSIKYISEFVIAAKNQMIFPAFLYILFIYLRIIVFLNNFNF